MYLCLERVIQKSVVTTTCNLNIRYSHFLMALASVQREESLSGKQEVDIRRTGEQEGKSEGRM